MARGQLTVAPVRSAIGRLAWAAAAMAAAALLHSLLYLHPGWLAIAAAAALALLAAVRPFDALLVLAGLGPLAPVLFPLIGHTSGIHVSETLTLAFLAGAAAWRAIDGRAGAIPPRLGWSAAILIAALVASGLVAAAVLRAEQPALTLGGALPIVLIQHYLVLQNPFTAAIQFAEGVLLLVLTAAICAGDQVRRDRVIRMMIAGAAAAASLNIARVVTAALHQEAFWRALAFNVTQIRVNVLFSDWNAAGSYFGMMLIAGAFAARRRPALALSVLPIAGALWLTGSRTALAAVVLVTVAAGLLAARGPGVRANARRLAAVALLVAIAMAGWTWYPAGRNDAAAFSFRGRMELSKAGLRMAADHPLFGVGPGEFYAHSDEYAGEVLLSIGRERENAHNYFVQVLAELGIPGLLWFVAVLGFALRAAWPVTAAPMSAWALPGALVAFLLSCLGGHPLIVPEASYPFWIVAGLGAAGARAAVPVGRWVPWAAAAAILMYAVSVPIRAADAVRHANLANTTIGLSGWHRDAGGRRYRWADGRSTFFVPASAVAVVLPLRRGPGGPPLVARVFLDGREANRVEVADGDGWRYLRLATSLRPRGDYQRIDVEVMLPAGAEPRAASALLAVGQAEIVWDVGGASVPTADVPLLGDIDGDGKADLVVWSVDSGTWRWLTSSTSYDSMAVHSRPWRDQGLGGVPLLGDLDGDGKADLVIWRAARGTWHWRTSSSGYSRTSAASPLWADQDPREVPLLGDLDGDGKADLIVWRPGTRAWRWLTSSSGYAAAGTFVSALTASGQPPVPLVSDVDADRRAELSLWGVDAAATGAIESASSSGAATTIAGPAWQPGDVPLLADVDRDGRADPIVWRGTTGTWTWLTSSSGRAATAGERQWGNKGLGDIPLVADIDGDGAADFAVWRATTRTWYWITSSSAYNPAAAGLKPWPF